MMYPWSKHVNSIGIRVRYVHSCRARLATSAASDSTAAEQNDSEKKYTGRISKKIQNERGTDAFTENEGKKFDILARRNWLHPKRPFPKNPWFVPPSPFGNAKREQVYRDYVSDPVYWTPRRLADKYQISVVRAEAVLRLKHLEKIQQEDGYVLQSSFSAKMEGLLGVGSEPMIYENVVADSEPRSSKLPSFVLHDSSDMRYTESGGTVDSGSSGSVVVKKRDQLVAADFKRRADGNYILPLSEVISEPEPDIVVLEEDNPREVNKRYDFIVADLGSQAGEDRDATVVVREKNGRLRTASLEEKRMHFDLFPRKTIAQLQEDTVQELWKI